MTAPARPASTVCVLRGAPDGIEVLMVRRGPGARFMAGAWVFPGGVVESGDDPTGTGRQSDLAFERAALRELAEEASLWVTTAPMTAPAERLVGADVYEHLQDVGIEFDVERLAYFANWVTPTMIPLRFDTRFYAVEVDHTAAPDVDGDELDAHEWVRPGDVAAAAERRERIVPLPTRQVLRLLDGFGSPADFLAHVAGLGAVEPVQAKGRVAADGSIEVVMPGEPGYDDLVDDPPPDELSERARAALRFGHLAEVGTDES